MTDRDVAEIKTLLAAGMAQKFLAEHYNISQSVVSSISTGRCWKEVEPFDGVCAVSCGTCEALIIDNGTDKALVYVVATDTYYCNEDCYAIEQKAH